jgi:hypothetical protein
VPPQNRINPRPGGPSKIKKGQKTPPFILNEAEVSEWTAGSDGFLILASDGVWDEMSCEEAVETVAEYLSQTEEQRGQRKAVLPGEGNGAAAVLVEAALRKAHARIVGTIEEEEETTFEELLARPPGKNDTWPYGRSLLHDDITALVVEMPLSAATADERHACVETQARRTQWALAPEAGQDEPQEQDGAAETAAASADSGSEEDEYEGGRDVRLRRQTVDNLGAEEEAAILDALDDGDGAPRLRRQTVDLDWDDDQAPLL